MNTTSVSLFEYYLYIHPCLCTLCVTYVEWSGWIMKMDEGAGNEHDYNDDHDLAHTAKNYEQ